MSRGQNSTAETTGPPGPSLPPSGCPWLPRLCFPLGEREGVGAQREHGSIQGLQGTGRDWGDGQPWHRCTVGIAEPVLSFPPRLAEDRVAPPSGHIGEGGRLGQEARSLVPVMLERQLFGCQRLRTLGDSWDPGEGHREVSQQETRSQITEGTLRLGGRGGLAPGPLTPSRPFWSCHTCPRGPEATGCPAAPLRHGGPARPAARGTRSGVAGRLIVSMGDDFQGEISSPVESLSFKATRKMSSPPRSARNVLLSRRI